MKTADGGWRVDNLALSLASAKLAGNVAIGADQLANGELSFSAANLDDLSPLVLTKMSGALQAKVSASAVGGRQAVAIAATQRPDGVRREQGRRPQGRSQHRRSLGRAKRLGSRPARSRRSRRTNDFGRQADRDRPEGDSSDLDFTGSVFGFALAAHGRLSGGPPIRLDLATFTAQRGGRKIALAGPAAITYGKDGIDDREPRPARRFRSPRRSPATPGPRLTSARARPRCRSRRSISFRRASARREPPTARRRSAERRAIRPATGASGSGR